jgi:hypothetical protein
MSAFDWGIRFEPVVKQIYEYKYGAMVKELGRLQNPMDARCTASPDGLVYSSAFPERIGRLIEIKCPVTREIDGTIPKDYYAQMQMQLQVTQLMQCDYVEVSFLSPYNSTNNNEKSGPGLFNGYIAVIRYESITNSQEFYYVYSPIHAPTDWLPEYKEEEDLIEIVPWRVMQWHEQLVVRNEAWWSSVVPMMDVFWEDVAKAKEGEFQIPESTRPAKKPKVEKCMVVFRKLDENGNI